MHSFVGNLFILLKYFDKKNIYLRQTHMVLVMHGIIYKSKSVLDIYILFINKLERVNSRKKMGK